MLTTEATELFDRAVLCWLATVSDAGQPTVSPKEVFCVKSSTELLIADIASPKSTRNARGQPRVCVSAVDVFEQHGYQVYGTARVVGTDDAEFAELSEPLRAVAEPRFPVRSVIAVEIESVSRILAPSLWMYPEVSAPERRAGVLAAYGVAELPPLS